MLEAVLIGAAIVAASLIIGQAVMVACGARGPSAVAPAVGLSVLITVAGIAVKLPGRGGTALVALLACVAAGIWVLARGPAEGRRLRGSSLAVIAIAALVAAVPFAAVGRVGILGQGLVNDDMASHLLFAEWADTGRGETPDLIGDGYPLGPHALAAAAARPAGDGLVEAFAGLTGALGVLLALTAYGALRGVARPLRAPAAVLVAFSYLSAAWLVQGAFKEPMLALAVLGFGLALPALRPHFTPQQRGRGLTQHPAVAAAIPPGLIAAGTIYNYSFPGLAWLVLAAIAWAGLVAWRERSALDGLKLRERLRTARVAIGVGVGIAVIAAIPENIRLIEFAGFEAFSPTGEGEGGRVGFGNLRDPLPPTEALGIWPSSEFRILPGNSSTPALLFHLGSLLGLAAVGWGMARALARRELALPATLIAVAGAYLAAVAAGTPYTSAKGLAVATPVIVLVALRGLLRADQVPGEEGEAAHEPAAATGSRAARIAETVTAWVPGPLVALVAVAFIGAAAFSSALALRQPAIGPAEQLDELAALRPVVEGKRVLFLGRDNFVAWKLIGAEVEAPVLNHYNVRELPAFYKPTSERAKLDFDAVPTEVLDSFDYVLTTDSPQRSAAPDELRIAQRTDRYVLWERTGETAGRRTLREPSGPGAFVDCGTAEGRALTSLDGEATIFNEVPVISSVWVPGDEITGGRTTVDELRLGPGRWSISLQYASTHAARFRGAGLDVELEPNLLFRGPAPYFEMGEIELGSRRTIEFGFELERAPAIGRLLRSEARAFLGPIVATPIPATREVPLSEACGAYLDSFRPAPGTPAGALDPIEFPVAPDPENVVQD